MSRMLGAADLLRAEAWSNEERFDQRRPFSAWPRSRSLGQQLNSTFFNSTWEVDWKETSGGPATPLVAAFESRGHIADANTLLLLRFDDLVVSDYPAYQYADSRGVTWTLPEGIPGFTDFTPVPGAYARTFVRGTAGGTTESTTMTSATSAALRNVLIGSWTFETFVRFDNLIPVQILFTHSAGGETSPTNHLAQIGVLDTGFVRILWETGAGVNTVLTQSAGRPLVEGAWEYLAIVKDTVANTVAIYLGGVLQETIAFVNDPSDGSGGIPLIGVNEAGSTERFEGAIREIALHSVPHATARIEQNYLRMSTSGTFQRDANTFMVLDFGTHPATVDSGPKKLHAFVDSASNQSKTYTSASLIADDGHGAGFNSSYLSVGFDHDIRAALLDDFTFECWYRPIILPDPAGGLFHFGGNPALETEAENRIGANINADGSIGITGEFGAGLNVENAHAPAGTIAPGNRYHIAFRKTMTGATFTMAIFVNGVKVVEQSGNTNWTGATNVETVYLLIGAGTGQAGALAYAIGAMDDVHISDVARTDAEILADYLRGADEGGPIIENVDPVEGAVIGRMDAIEFDVTDTAGVGSIDEIVVTYVDDTTEVVYDGAAFQGAFAAGSDIDAVGDDFHVTIQKTWSKSIAKFTVTATDEIGNESMSEIGSWIVSFAAAPEVTAASPLAGATIEADDDIVLTVESEDGDVESVDSITVRLIGSGIAVEIYDGVSFDAPYLGSDIDITAGVATVTLAYDGGWIVGVAEVVVTATAVGGAQASDEVGSWFFDAEAVEVETPEPVAVEVTEESPFETIDHIAAALDRLPVQLRKPR